MANTKSKKNKKLASNNSGLSLSKIKSTHIFIIAGLTIFTLLIASNIQTKHEIKLNTQSVLGEDEQSEDEKQLEQQIRETEKQQEEDFEDSQKQENENEDNDEDNLSSSEDNPEPPRTSIKSKSESYTSDGLKIKSEIENNKEETEIETLDGKKIKTKIEDDGTTKIEVEDGTVKLKYKIENGQVVLNVENEDGKEVEIEDEELEELEKEVENILEKDDVKLIPTLDNQLALTQNKFAALTNFPLSINIETKQLIITTPNGQKVITVLPEVAIQNLLNTGIINIIDTSPTDILPQDQIDNPTGIIKIETYDDKIVYTIKGEKTHKILGLIPVNTPVTAFVSTDSGLPIAKEQSLLTDIIDFISL